LLVKWIWNQAAAFQFKPIKSCMGKILLEDMLCLFPAMDFLQLSAI